MRVTFLVDNYVDQPSLKAEHGFSCLIEFNGKKFLFDTGQTDAVFENAKKIGVDLKTLDFIVLSHGHYDHTGGLISILDKSVKVYASEKIFMEHLRQNKDGSYCYIGINRYIVKNFSKNFIFNEDLLEIENNIFISGTIKRKVEFDSDKNLFKNVDNAIAKDDFPDEQYLVVKEDEDFSIFTGCSHAGIVNILEDFYEKFGNKRINFLVGGFHLFRSSYDEVNSVIDYLMGKEIRHIFTGHCTGLEALLQMKLKLGGRLVPIKVGMVVG
ncbi:MAG: MBL fold metallo-hydrolase [Deferribacterales bacterium]